MSNLFHQMATGPSVPKSADGATRICDRIKCVVRIVGPDSRSPGVLLRYMPSLQTTVSVIAANRILISGATLGSRILADLCDLVANIVSSDRRRIDTSAFPIVHFRFDEPTQDIRVDLPLSSFGDAAIQGAFIRQSQYFTTSATATGV